MLSEPQIEARIAALETAHKRYAGSASSSAAETSDSSWVGVAGILIAILAVGKLSDSIDLGLVLKSTVSYAADRIPLFGVFAGMIALIIGYLLYRARELAKNPVYPYAELLIGTVACSYGADKYDLSGAIAFLTGLRIIVDGFKRMIEFPRIIEVFNRSRWSAIIFKQRTL